MIINSVRSFEEQLIDELKKPPYLSSHYYRMKKKRKGKISKKNNSIFINEELPVEKMQRDTEVNLF